MKVIPAIDIKNKRVVRLYKGKFDSAKIYDVDPVEIASNFRRLGFDELHVIDLDSAKDGSEKNFEIIKKIINVFGNNVQLGGGIRTLKRVELLKSIGVKKVILGTVVYKDEETFLKIIEKYIDMVVVAVDSIGEEIMINGWEKKSSKNLFEEVSYLSSIGINEFLFTDIDRDGTLSGPNLRVLAKLLKISPNIIASGGVGNHNDLFELQKIGIKKVVVGKALYEGNVDMEFIKDNFITNKTVDNK